MKSKTKCYLQVNVGTSQIKNNRIHCKLSFENHINQLWVKVFKNGPSKIYGRQPLNLK